MTNRTWIGGANNQASNPKDWSPKGAPHSGDALTMTSGTMNVIHDDLAGDVLAINSGTVNLTRGSNATIAANGDALINIQGTDQLLLDVVPTGWVNTFPTVPPPPVGGSATVNLAANSMWVGGIFSVGALTINGGSNSVFQNNGLIFWENPLSSQDIRPSTQMLGVQVRLKSKAGTTRLHWNSVNR
jgi:hypothetical protein